MHDMSYYAAIILLGAFLSAVAQVMLKKAATKLRSSIIGEYFNVEVCLAYAIFLGTTLMTVYAMRGIPLSLVPILEASIYIYIAFFGVTIFKERLNRYKVAGLFLIVAGIVVYAWLG